MPDDDDLCDKRRHQPDGSLQQRLIAEWQGCLVAPHASRTAAGEHHRTRLLKAESLEGHRQELERSRF
jgi:hypothetical protein